MCDSAKSKSLHHNFWIEHQSYKNSAERIFPGNAYPFELNTARYSYSPKWWTLHIWAMACKRYYPVASHTLCLWQLIRIQLPFCSVMNIIFRMNSTFLMVKEEGESKGYLFLQSIPQQEAAWCRSDRGISCLICTTPKFLCWLCPLLSRRPEEITQPLCPYRSSSVK